MAFVNERTEDGKWQTINHDEGIILRPVEWGREKYTRFELDVAGSVVKFTAVYNLEPIGKSGKANMSWNVIQISVPEKFAIEKDLLWDFISQALKAHGFSHHTEDITNVSVVKSPKISLI